MAQNSMPQTLSMEDSKITVKKILNIVLILSLVFLILFVCSRVLMLKSEDGISQWHSYYKQKPNTVDVLFIGSSHVYCDIDNGILWDDYGISSYDLGGAESPMWVTYYHLKEAMKYQTPKAVFMEISLAGIRQVNEQPEFWTEDNNYGMRWNANRINQLKDNTIEKTFPKILFPLSAMHTRYKELNENDFTDKNNSINYKGFDPRWGTTEFETPDAFAITEEEPISEKSEKYFRKIIDLVKEENIPMVMFVSPYYFEESEQRMFNYMFRIAEEEGIDGINFNYYYENMGLDFSTDMAENLHLNSLGTQKFTKYFGQIIKDSFELTDHRGDPKYSSWDVCAENNRMERADFNLFQSKTASEFLEQCKNDNYMMIASFGKNVTEVGIYEQTFKDIIDAGIPIEYITPGNTVVIESGVVKLANNAEQFRIPITEEYGRFLLKRYKEEEYSENYTTTIDMGTSKYKMSDDGAQIYVYDMYRKEMVAHINITGAEAEIVKDSKDIY